MGMETYGILACELLRAYTGRTVCRVSEEGYGRNCRYLTKRWRKTQKINVLIIRANFLRSSGAEEVTGFVHSGGDRDVEKSDHHFIVGLIAPADCYVGVGIMWIVFGIVVPRDGLEH